jgi:hypothetical protein
VPFPPDGIELYSKDSDVSHQGCESGGNWPQVRPVALQSLSVYCVRLASPVSTSNVQS